MHGKTHLIGITGYIGSGKDTVARILSKHYQFKKIAYADPVKDVVSATFGWDREMLEGNSAISRKFRNEVDKWWCEHLGRDDFTPRKALQEIGTELFRDRFHNEIWVLTAMKKASENNRTIISDVRFPNEAKAITDRGGIIIRVNPKVLPQWHEVGVAASNGCKISIDLMSSKFPDVHSSEWQVSGIDVDYTVNNDGTLQSLEKTIVDDVPKLIGLAQ